MAFDFTTTTKQRTPLMEIDLGATTLRYADQHLSLSDGTHYEGRNSMNETNNKQPVSVNGRSYAWPDAPLVLVCIDLVLLVVELVILVVMDEDDVQG